MSRSAQDTTTPPAAPPPGDGRRTLTFTRTGVVASILLLVMIALCVRLGFWQLSRHEQRQQRNEQVAARLAMPPLPAIAGIADTTGIFYRRVTVSGSYDNDRSVVLPGRSYRGAPGVHLLTPLRTAERAVVLVNRGWAPSADAATIDIADFAVHDTVTFTALVLPFPSAAHSLAQRGGVPAGDGSFRRVWYVVDEQALRAQFPYPLLPVMLQALPEPDAGPAARGAYPVRLEPPPLGAGTHFGYALQWFSFALIGLTGWIVLLLRSRAGPVTASTPGS